MTFGYRYFTEYSEVHNDTSVLAQVDIRS